MEQLHSQLTLQLAEGAFPLSTDSVALAGFVRLHKQDTVLDLGSGCGTLALLLRGKDPSCLVTGIELKQSDHLCALENFRRNGLQEQLHSIHGDIRDIKSLVAASSFHCAVSNPPYFTAGPQSAKTPQARREDCCNLTDLFQAAAWAVRYGGDFYLVHRPERLAEICAVAAQHQFEPKRLCLLRHQEGGSVTLVLLQCRKGGKPGLVWEELCLHDRQGQPTADYRKLYHL